MNMSFNRELDAMKDYLLKIIWEDYGIGLDEKDNYSMYEAMRRE